MIKTIVQEFDEDGKLIKQTIVSQEAETDYRPITLSPDNTRSCPCRPENGGSGVCGCIFGGVKVTC